MRRRIVGYLGLVAALAAIAVLMTVGLMSILFGCARTLYWLPSTSDIVGVLLIWLTAVWVVAGLVLAPPRRPRRSPVRMVRAAVSRGRGRSSTSGPATVPVSGWPGAVAPTSARPSATSPVGGRAGAIPSPSWRSA